MKAAIIPVNTLEYRGAKKDLCGPVIKKAVEQAGFEVKFLKVLPEAKDVLSKIMSVLADENVADLIITAGSVGFTDSDCISEATKDVIEKELPGIPEAVRTQCMKISRKAMLTRGTAGIRKNTLIVNLPDSPKEVKEALDYIMPELLYASEILSGKTNGDKE